MQLHHAGNRSPKDIVGTPVCPSDDPETGARGLSLGEVEQLIEDFVAAAVRAERAGFDGVEVHGAHGYILAQFLSPEINRREDRYGGSIENRARLTLEVVEAVAGVWAADRVGLRLSPLSTAIGDTPLDSQPQPTHAYLAGRLGALGLAYLHVVEGQMHAEDGSSRFDNAALRQAFGGAYIANNGYDRQRAIAATAAGHADMVAFGRDFIGNPDLVERLQHGLPLFNAPASGYFGGGAEGYTEFTAAKAA